MDNLYLRALLVDRPKVHTCCNGLTVLINKILVLCRHARSRLTTCLKLLQESVKVHLKVDLSLVLCLPLAAVPVVVVEDAYLVVRLESMEQ